MGAWSATRGSSIAARRIVLAAAVTIALAAAGVAAALSSGQLATFGGDPVTSVDPVAAPTDDATTTPAPTVTPPGAREVDEQALRGLDSRSPADSAERQRAAEEAHRTAAERQRAEEARRKAEEEARRREQARVTAFQERLRDLGYLIGTVDGAQGQQTTAAVMAFQSVAGLQVDGVVGPQTQAALDDPPASPQLRDGAATRLEVDLDLQVLHLVEGGERIVTMKVSSGNGETYDRPTGGQGVARTPVGQFTITRRIRGVRESSAGLGTLYDPMYFHGGFAVHGSGSVPPWPASHGCVRLSRADATWLFDRVPNGTPVVLYGGQHTFSP